MPLAAVEHLLAALRSGREVVLPRIVDKACSTLSRRPSRAPSVPAYFSSSARMSHAVQHRPEDKKSDDTGASINEKQAFAAAVHIHEALPAGSVDPVYAAKAQALNGAIQSIGMGRYQVRLFSSSFSATFRRAGLVRPRVPPPFHRYTFLFLVGLITGRP
jgi:hypothetical protein